MGVRGLNTFISENQRYLYETKNIESCKLVIDGFNLVHELYYLCEADTAYGGDYDVYADSIDRFLSKLGSCHVRAYFIFDGTIDLSGRKFSTVVTRSQERTHLVNLSRHRKRAKVLPILAYRTFIDKLSERSLPYCVCDHEADQDVAMLGYQWNCPVVSNDTDLLLYDLPAGVIKLDNLHIHDVIHKTMKGDWLVSIYYVSNLRKVFGIKDHAILPLISVICGNDHLPPTYLERFRKSLNNRPKSFEIGKYIDWLAKFTDVTQATAALLEECNQRHRVKKLVPEILTQYTISSEKLYLTDYLDNKEISHRGTHPIYTQLPEKFWLNFRDGLISKDILEVFIFQRRILSTQMEKIELPTAWNCSRQIRYMVYKTVSVSVSSSILNVDEYCRKKMRITAHKIVLKQLDNVISIAEIYDNKSQDERRSVYLQYLELGKEVCFRITHSDLLNHDQKIVTAMIVYWIKNSNPHPYQIHLQSLLVSIISLSLDRDGVHGRASKFSTTPEQDQEHKYGLDLDIVHALAQFQCVLSDSLDLLGLMDIEFGTRIDELFSGRFTYNLCIELSRRVQPLLYCKELLDRKSAIAELFTRWYDLITSLCGSDSLSIVGNTRLSMGKRSRRRQEAKAKNKLKEGKQTGHQQSGTESNSDDEVDNNDLLNNMFALLSVKNA